MYPSHNHLRSCITALLCVFTPYAVGGQPDWYDNGSVSSSGLSITVLVIGFAHALPIMYVAHRSNSRAIVVVVSLVMCFVAFAVGNIAYLALDLIFVALGTFIGWKLVEPPKQEWSSFAKHSEPAAPSVESVEGRLTVESYSTDLDQTKHKETDFFQLGKTRYFAEGSRQNGIQLLESAAMNGNPWASKFLGDAYLLDTSLATRPVIAANWYRHARGILKDEWDEGLTASIHVAKLAAEQGAASPEAVLSICEDACQDPCQERADSSAACFLMERYMSSNNPVVRQKAVRLATKFSVPTSATEEAVARIFMADEMSACKVLGCLRMKKLGTCITRANKIRLESLMERLSSEEEVLYSNYEQMLDEAKKYQKTAALMNTLPMPALTKAVAGWPYSFL